MDDMLAEVKRFQERVGDVAERRDLWTATERGAELNRIISRLDREADRFSPGQRALLELAHTHVAEMMNCPRRMRLDDTWQDDFVVAARKAAEAVVSLLCMSAK